MSLAVIVALIVVVIVAIAVVALPAINGILVIIFAAAIDVEGRVAPIDHEDDQIRVGLHSQQNNDLAPVIAVSAQIEYLEQGEALAAVIARDQNQVGAGQFAEAVALAV